jgi:deazaflavin-dependent oxidoreductase (nitroreductase family)
VSHALQALARQPVGYRWLMKRGAWIARGERALRRVSKDRLGVLDLMGVPSIQVTVPGRKTGIPRTTSLQYVPDGDVLLLVGSNWGKVEHPAWSANCMAVRQLAARRGDERFTASVRMLSGVEREQAWDKAVAFWPNYAIAQELAGGRVFRLFALERIG